MRFTFYRRTEGQIEFGIIYGLIALLVLIAARLLPLLDVAPSCVFKGLSGIPCPSCGATRSVVFLSHGRVADAFLMNPAVATVVLIVVLYFLYSLFVYVLGLPKIFLDLTGKEKDRVRLTVVLLIAANWLYIIISR